MVLTQKVELKSGCERLNFERDLIEFKILYKNIFPEKIEIILGAHIV